LFISVTPGAGKFTSAAEYKLHL